MEKKLVVAAVAAVAVVAAAVAVVAAAVAVAAVVSSADDFLEASASRGPLRKRIHKKTILKSSEC